MKLVHADSNNTLFTNLQIADTFYSRAIGLLGRNTLPPGDALLIKRCNSIHTFFMQFPIDAIFLDKKGQVKAIEENIKPFRLTLPHWKACDTIEVAAGRVSALGIKVGDTLNVVP